MTLLPVSSGITATSVAVTSIIKNDGGAAISQRGHVWSKTNTQPTVSDTKTELGGISGPFPFSFTDQLTSLENNTTYYVRPYATNSVGISYGPVLQVKTAVLPLVPNAPVAGLILTRAASVSSGGISENGGGAITQYGFVWSKTSDTPTPTLSNNKREFGAASGTAPYSLTALLTELTPGTTYSVRVFATNANGTAYGTATSIQSTTELTNAIVDKPQGRSTGDPHFATYDYATYAFRGAGEFVVTKSTTDKFEVQARQQEVKSLSSDGSVAFNTGVSINTGNDVVCLYPPNQVYVNKSLLSSSFTAQSLSNGGQLSKESNVVNVRSGQGDNVRVILYENYLDYYVQPAVARAGKLTGLMGNFDGNSKNDIVLPNGSAIATDYATLHSSYASAWRLEPLSSYFVYGNGQSSATFTDTAFPRKDVTLTNTQRSQAEQTCRTKGITDPIILDECITDVAVTGNTVLATRALDAQNAVRPVSTMTIGNFSDPNAPLGKLTNATIANGGVDLNAPAKAEVEIPLNRSVDLTGGFECSFEVSGTSGTRLYLKLIYNGGYTYGGLFSSQLVDPFMLWDYYVATPSVYKKDRTILDGRLHSIRLVVKPSASGIFTQMYIDNDLVYQSQNGKYTAALFTNYKTVSIAAYSDGPGPSQYHVQNLSFRTY